MYQIWKAKFWLASLFLALSIALSYESKTVFEHFSVWIVLPVNYFISTYLAQVLVSVALKFEHGRKCIFGKAWLEGYWHLQTANESTHLIEKDAITHFTLVGNDFHYQTVTYRYIKNKAVEVVAISDMIDFREFDLSYNNIFVFPKNNSEEKGISRGKFYIKQGSHPDSFEGYSIIFTEGVYRRQTANKISGKEIKKLEHEYGNDWKKYYLKNKARI